MLEKLWVISKTMIFFGVGMNCTRLIVRDIGRDDGGNVKNMKNENHRVKMSKYLL